jgi:ABC-type lipoprotein release transport system permease subunit
MSFRVIVLAAGISLALPLMAEEAVPEVLLSRQLVEARGIEVGDVVRLSADRSGADARPFRVVGVYEPAPDPFRLTAPRREARFHLDDLNALTGDPRDPLAAESVSRINLTLADPGDASAFETALVTRLPGVFVRSTRRATDGSDPFVALERFHVAIAAVTVLGSAAFLLALMIIRSEDRREAAGILRLIGFSRPRILLGVFVEGLWIALAGTLFGLLLALAVEGLFNRFFQWHYDTSLVFVRVTPGIALKCIAISVPLGVTAGVAASWTLLRRNIMLLLKR